MRLVTYEKDGSQRVGVKIDGGVADTGYTTMLDLIRDGDRGLAQAREVEAAGASVEPDKILAPLVPEKLLFHAINFQSLVDETEGASVPERSTWFSKLPSSIIGPGDPIVKPSPDTKLDWEVELAVVVGKGGKGIPVEDAMEHVFGYTVVNDVSARDIQMERPDLTLGKGCDTFCPMGPAIVLTDEITDPSALTVATYVNGERVQFEQLTEMLFDVAHNLAALSELVTLRPGDIVTTGTPAGLGYSMKPQRWLQPGDEVAVEVDAIGRVTNPVEAGWS